MSLLRYVYGIVPASAASDIDGAALSGIDGTPVRALAEGPFAVAMSELDASVYGEAGLNERIRDIDWLAPRAAAHQEVNARLLTLCGVVLPLAFGALYRDDERVREMLREDAAERSARLEALRGRAEWVVTVMRDSATVPDAEEALRELDAEIGASTPGRAFLLEKRRAAVATSAAQRADAEAAERALEALARRSERVYREPVAKGGADVVALRVSLLAPREGAASIDAEVATLAQELGPRGYRVRANGPWPAYRFGSLP